jgi:FlaA1/EpsC-like NDP-sugar epimerase
MAAMSLPLAIYLRRGDDALEQGSGPLVREALLFAAVAGVVFLALRLYRGIWRHATATDLVAVTRAAFLALLLYLPASFVVGRLTAVPRSVPVIQLLLLVAMLGGPRLGARLWAGPRRPDAKAEPVLVVGSGEGAAALLRALSALPASPFRAQGILAPDSRERGRSIGNVPVLGTFDDLGAVVGRLEWTDRRPVRVIVAESIDGSRLRRLVGEAGALGLTVARLSSAAVLAAALEGGSPRPLPVPLAELLGRPRVSLARAPVEVAIVGRRVLVTGAGGSIGSELVRQIAALGPARLVLIDNSEYALYAIEQELGESFPKLPKGAVLADVRDRTRISQVFAAERPEIVFHAAALKHVPMVERNPTEGVATNVLGSRNVAEAALAFGARAVVQVSTDKAVNPTNVMGASKRLAELYCQSLDKAVGRMEAGQGGGPMRVVTVRFGNVLGSSGSVVPLFQRQLARGGPLTLTHPEIKRFFMLIPEAVELVLHALAHGAREGAPRGQVLVLDMGEPIRIADLARHMIRLAGKEPDVDVKVEVTGLRPGEKLYEELFDSGEERGPPANGFMEARSKAPEMAFLRPALAELERACAAHDVARVRAVLARLVPGYAATAKNEEAEAA